MAELNVQQQNIIKQLKQAYPELKNYPDEQILSLYNQQLNDIQLSEAEKISIMSDKNKVGNDGMGLRLESSQRSVSKEQESQLKSALTARLNAVSTNVKKAEDSNGVIGSIWSWSKNNIPFLNKITDSSDEVREQQKADLEALENGNIAEAFKNITGLDYTVENVNKFLNNEVQTKSETALNGYTEGQTMALDVGADMISGILAVGALALVPVTGGASLLVAAGVGAATKVTIKALAPGEYSMKDLTYDSITGSINGALAPFTNGCGGAVGTGVAKFFGLEALESTAKTALSQAVKHAGKEVVEEVAEETVKQGGKSLLTKILAKQGSEYVLKEGAEKTLKTTVGKVAAYTADMMVDGSLSGAGDGFARALAEGRFEDIPEEMVNGLIGGAIASPFIGGGFRLVGNASSTVLNKINNKITFSSVLPDGTSTKFGQGQIGDCPLLSMIDGFLANDRTKGLLTNAIQTDVNGNFAVKIGDKTVTVLRSSLSDEMLADQSGIRIFEQAYKQIAGDLDGGFADAVAKHFGLNPLHITSDNITDEVLEKIANDSDNYVLSLGARINSDGVVTPDGEFQHYFSIKNIDPKTKTVTLVDTYDTSKTLTMSFDDVKTQGISIDGGSIGKTDLPNSVRNADDVKFRGDGPELDKMTTTKTFEERYKELRGKYKEATGESLTGITEENISLAEKLCADKDFPKELVEDIISSTNEQNITLAEKLCADKDFSKYYIGNILWRTNEQNITLAEKLCADKYFSEYRIGEILWSTNEQNITLAEKLCADKDFPANIIREILCSTNEQNIESKIKIYDLLKNDKDFLKDSIVKILKYTNKQSITLAEKLCADKDFPKEWVTNIISFTNDRNITFAEKLCADKDFPKDKIMHILKDTGKRNIAYLINQDTNALQDGVNLQLKKVLEAPKKYVNGEFSSESEMIDAVNKYFNKNAGSLMVFSAIFDKEAFNHLLRMRFDDVDDYINIINKFEPSDLDLLSIMKNAVNSHGKPFMPTQKVEFIDLLQAYKANGLDLTPIKQMTEAGQIDLGKLHINLFNQIMKNAGLSDTEIASIPKEKLTSWDTKYAHLLSKDIQESKDIAFSDILRAGTLEPDFMKYIHDTGNVYGQANARTQAMFAESGLDYEKWIHPSKDAEMKFTVKDRNTERLAQIADQILEDIETLRLGPVKGFIDKQFPHCIKDGKFIIPTEVMGSKAKLNEFTENIIKQLDGVWKRAQGNATNPDPKRAQTARGTLTILDHLNQRIKDVSAISEDKATKSLDWTIKMWDRVPQKDIFQGNYSTCCIAMGGGNGSAMPHYIMDTAYNMIELVDNNSGRTIGNALCYFVKGENGKLAFIIDNVEIANSVKPSDDVGESLRAMLTDYASKIAEDVTGSKDIPVYLGPDHNDIPYEDLPKHVEEVTFLGDIDCDEIYMDAFGASADWTDKADFTQKVKLLKL